MGGSALAHHCVKVDGRRCGVGERGESMMSRFDASQCKSLSLQSANLSKKGHKAHL